MENAQKLRAQLRDSGVHAPIRSPAALKQTFAELDREWIPDPREPLQQVNRYTEIDEDPYDIELSIEEAAFWWDQLCATSMWSTEVKSRQNQSLNPAYREHPFTAIFGGWSKKYAVAYEENLNLDRFELEQMDPKERDRHDVRLGWRRYDTYCALTEAVLTLPTDEAESTLMHFFRAVIAYKTTVQVGWFKKAKDALEWDYSKGPRQPLPDVWDNRWLEAFDHLINVILPQVREVIYGAIQEQEGSLSAKGFDLKEQVFEAHCLQIKAMYQTAFDDAEKRKATHVELNTELMTTMRTIQEASAKLAEDSINRRIGFQLRSFRVQKSLTLKELATHILKASGILDGPADGILSDISHEKIIKLEINKLSRLERGDRGKRGIDPSWEASICAILGCTERELKYAPLGYQLPGGDPVQLDIGMEEKKGNSQVKLSVEKAPHLVHPEINTYSFTDSELEVYKTEQISAGVAFIPPTRMGMPSEILTDKSKIELMRCIMTYHWPHLAALVDQVSGLSSGIKIPTRTEIQITAEHNALEIDWGFVENAGTLIYPYAARVAAAGYLDAGCLITSDEGGKWQSMYCEDITDQFDSPEETSKLEDEVAKTARPSSFPSDIKRETIPVLGFARGGGWDMEFADNGNAFEHIETPPVLDNIKGAFAVVVSNDSMEPRYDAGDYLYCHPNKTPRKGDYVVVSMTDQRAIVKRFMRQTPDSIHLEQLNPQEDLQVDRSDVIRMFVICGTKTA